MADNYLEKQMEDYRAGKLAGKPRVVMHTTSAPAHRPGDFSLQFEPLRVAVFGGDIRVVAALARLFRGVECRVALCSSDSKAYTPLAQSTGCRYYPFDPDVESKRMAVVDDLTSRWGGVDVALDLRELCEETTVGPSHGEVRDDEPSVVGVSAGGQITDESAGPLATLLFLHCHPQFGCISTTEIRLENMNDEID